LHVDFVGRGFLSKKIGLVLTAEKCVFAGGFAEMRVLGVVFWMVNRGEVVVKVWTEDGRENVSEVAPSF
jgi:hypothetical protein